MFASIIESRQAATRTIRSARLVSRGLRFNSSGPSTSQPEKLGESSKSVETPIATSEESSDHAAYASTEGEAERFSESADVDEIIPPESFGQPGPSRRPLQSSNDEIVDSIIGNHFTPGHSSTYTPAGREGSGWSSDALKALSTPSTRYDTAPPRRLRGVHDRRARQMGQTPAEAEKFNQVLASIFADLERTSGPLRPGSGTDPGTGLFSTSLGAGGMWHRPSDIRSRRTGEDEGEMDNTAMAELDQLKEEMSALSTDVDVLEWAKEKVFAKRPSTVEGEEPGFPKTYPHILAHTIRVIRENYNNPHLALALFHHAQTSSLESYISGCLIGAYNELLTIRWESFRDLRGVEMAVIEMDTNGVRWDRETKTVLSKICSEVTAALAGGRKMTIWGDTATAEARLLTIEQRLEQDMDKQLHIDGEKRRQRELEMGRRVREQDQNDRWAR